jgi:hypothetical protein
MSRGYRRLGLDPSRPLPAGITLNEVLQAGCQAGGMQEVLRNYDGPVGTRKRIEDMRKAGFSDEYIYRVLARERKIH